MVSTDIEFREPIETAIRRFGDNVVEFLGCTDVSKTELVKHKHRQIADFVKPKSATARKELPEVLNLLRGKGFGEHFTLTMEQFNNMNVETFRLCCDGTREFFNEWTTFSSLYSSLTVFAFKDHRDAVMVRMHVWS